MWNKHVWDGSQIVKVIRANSFTDQTYWSLLLIFMYWSSLIVPTTQSVSLPCSESIINIPHKDNSVYRWRTSSTLDHLMTPQIGGSKLLKWGQTSTYNCKWGPLKQKGIFMSQTSCGSRITRWRCGANLQRGHFSVEMYHVYAKMKELGPVLERGRVGAGGAP